MSKADFDKLNAEIGPKLKAKFSELYNAAGKPTEISEEFAAKYFAQVKELHQTSAVRAYDALLPTTIQFRQSSNSTYKLTILDLRKEFKDNGAENASWPFKSLSDVYGTLSGTAHWFVHDLGYDAFELDIVSSSGALILIDNNSTVRKNRHQPRSGQIHANTTSKVEQAVTELYNAAGNPTELDSDFIARYFDIVKALYIGGKDSLSEHWRSVAALRVDPQGLRNITLRMLHKQFKPTGIQIWDADVPGLSFCHGALTGSASWFLSPLPGGFFYAVIIGKESFSIFISRKSYKVDSDHGEGMWIDV
ncbi:hypothetical protein CONPUDRAFT_167715 [Coniophora puteana RWD-64-598 SS2]|uniref:Uncharacterized protein n=1 Tax=Coniophora puteana (strain RWD-64-598) TaxID=741705 RepID=A0A5M3MG09_CONPW|nr:uncharacterized protein CONPUDRAFT_167715 [Coniophora puteana RWD-64-598 SS2]EIW77555.1 hypothetical protein CONPUDRAFT_167715 [Coniophora puteana RWD-64-598 SS2]